MNGTAVASAPPVDRAAAGRAGDQGALNRYLALGYRAIARNWRCPLGEIDLVVSRGGLLVFCEVKTRLGSAFGGGYEAVTWRKQRKLRQLGEVFLLTNGLDPARSRFDVASVAAGPGRSASVQVPPERLGRFAFSAELSLRGTLMPTPGILSVAIAASRAGMEGVVVPEANGGEAALVEGLTVVAAPSLAKVAEFLRGQWR